MSTGYTSSGLPPDYPTAGRYPNVVLDVQALRAIRVVRNAGVVPIIERLLGDHPGRRSQLSVEAMLTAAVLSAETLSTYNRTDVCRTLAGLSARIRTRLGLPDTPIPYKTVSRQYRRLETKLADNPVADGEQVGLRWLVQRVIEASVPEQFRQTGTEIALDATAFPTFARTVDYTPQTDIDPADPPPGVRVGEDGKIIRCADPDARAGHRTGTSYYPSGPFTGYFFTTAVAARPGRWTGDPERFHQGNPVPPYVLALSVDPASHNPGPIGAAVTRAAWRNAPNTTVVKADAGYTDKYPTFNRPLHKEGWTIVAKPSKAETRRVRTLTAGRHQTIMLEHCGTFLWHWIPEGRRLPDPELAGDKLTDWYNERARLLRSSVVETYRDGSQRFRCPQCAGRVLTTAKTRNPTPTARKRRNRLPVSFAVDSEYCCDGTVRVPPELLDRTQRTPYGTAAWHTDYNGRNQAENVNSMLKGNGGIDKRSCRPHGLAAHTIAALALAVAHNIQLAARPDPTSTPKHTPHVTDATAEQSPPLPAEHNPDQHPRAPPQTA